MGISAKDVHVCVCRVMGFTMKTCQTIATKHPLASSVTLTSFVLYIFLPTIFTFLLYASPIIIGVIGYGYFYVSTKYSSTKVCKKDENSESKGVKNVDDGSKQKKPLMRSQLSVRRNARKTYKEWDAEGGETSQNEEKPTIFTEEEECMLNGFKIKSPGGGEIVDLISSNGSEQQPEESSRCGEENVSGSGLDNSSFVGKIDSSEGEDDEEDETQEDGSKAVEWNEDDQKNLMDLGDSEIERNKRLESLIARRRARKLFKMQAEKILKHGENVPLTQVAPIFVARTNPFESQSSFNEAISGCLDTPGSAPSILFPSRNPFDLPYEPFEEKPDLTADSFQQEFTPAQQKDMLFCRHQSFSHGPFFQSEPRRPWNDYRFGPLPERPPQPIVRRPSNTGDAEQQAEISSHESEPIRDSVYASEVDGPENKADNVMDFDFKHEEDRNSNNNLTEMKREQVRNALVDMESSLDDQSEFKFETHLVKYNISEPSSPSSVEGRRHIYNQKKTGSSENLQRRRGVFPPVLSNPVQNSFGCPIPTGLPVNEHLFYSSPVNKSKMEERSYYTNRRGCHTPTFSIASDMQVEPSEVSSPPAMIDEAPSSPDRESLTYDGDIEKGHSSGDEDMFTSFNARSTVANDVLEAAITEAITSSKPLKQITEQDLNNNGSFSGTAITEKVQNIDHIANRDAELVTERDREPHSFSFPISPNDHETKTQLIDQLMGGSLGLFQNLAGISNPPIKPEEQATVIEYVDDPVVHANDDIEDSSLLEKRENVSMIPIKQEEEGSTSKTMDETETILPSRQDTLYDQNIPEVGISGVSESSNDLVESSVQQEQVVEQVSDSSSSSSSPTSVLDHERHQSDHQRHVDLAQSGMENVVDNILPDEQTFQNLSSALHQNAGHDPFDSLTSRSITENSEEQSDALGNSTETTSMMFNSSEPVFDERSFEEGFSINTNDHKSESLVSNELEIETSSKMEENDLKPNGSRHVEELTVPEPIIESSKVEETTHGDVLKTTEKDEESRHHHGELNEEANASNDPNIVGEQQAEGRPESVQDEQQTELLVGHDNTSLETIKPDEVVASQVSDNLSSSTNINHGPSGEGDGQQDVTHPATSADDRGDSKD
ncbi:hypothetical protein ACFE04_014248 [Oxalis oulophora]